MKAHKIVTDSVHHGSPLNM